MSSRDEAEKWANDTNGGDGYTPVEAFIRGYLRGERVTLDHVRRKGRVEVPHHMPICANCGHDADKAKENNR